MLWPEHDNLTAIVDSDATAAESIKAVQDNISGAQGAIGVIGKALITGQKAPAEARDQVLNNLTDATAALGNITS